MKPLLRTIAREWGIIARRPLLWVVTIGVPLFSALFMSTIFGEGVMRELPIAVVDNDFSASSRALVRTIDSSPALSVIHHFTSPDEALRAMRTRQIYGYVVIPRGFERDMVRGTHTTIPYYYHYAFLSVGAEIESALRTLLTMVSLAPIITTAQELGVSKESIENFLVPLSGDIHPLGNPTLNYHTYLTEPLFFIMFQIIVMLTVVYVVGWDIDCGGGKEWLAVSGDNILVAIVGKLLPYVTAFVLSGTIALFVIYGISSKVWGLVGAVVLLVVSSTSLALFIYSLFPVMGLIISAVSMVGSLGATLSGVTFPLAAMYPIFRTAALLLPIRHFTLIAQNELYGSGYWTAVWWHYATLVGFSLLLLLSLPRLRRAIISRRYEKTL